MKVLFCPCRLVGNTLKEREYEARLSSLFEAYVDSLMLHVNADRNEVFDLVHACDILAYLPYRENEVDEETAFAINVAQKLGKKIYRVNPTSIMKED